MNYRKNGKKKYIFLALAILIVLGVASAFLAQISDDNQGYRTISVVEISGNVGVVKNGIEYKAYPGMLLQEGQEIITGGGSYVRLVLDDDKYIKMESGSRAIFDTLGLLGTGKTRINLERGSLVSELVNPLGADDEYIVSTPNAVLAVRGTFFRVDLSVKKDGDVTADVMTYGGQVASKRIHPTGEIVDEEVLIDAGYKATINMTQEETHYVVETAVGETIVVDPSATGVVEGENVLLPTQPITIQNIPDEDLVDIYFAAENGHQLFVTAEEAKEDLEKRNIIVEERTSVYEKAEEVLKPIDGTSNTTNAAIKADDSQPIAKVDDVLEKNETIKQEVASNVGDPKMDGVSNRVEAEEKPVEQEEIVDEAPVDEPQEVVRRDETEEESDVEEEPATEEPSTEESSTEEPSTEEPSTEEPSTEEPPTEEPPTEEPSTEEPPTEEQHVHTVVYGGTEGIHTLCSVCNEVISIEHSYVNTTHVEPNCSVAGSDTYVCDCGYTYVEEVAALGHDYESEYTIDIEATCTEDGSKSIHCKVCDEVKDVVAIEATGHTMVNTAYVAPNCKDVGSCTYECDCGYAYVEEVAAIGHNYESEYTIDIEATCTTGGSKSIHCKQCNEVKDVVEIEATGHTMVNTAYVAPSCTDVGSRTYACDCGYTYEEEVAALGHSRVVEYIDGTAEAEGKMLDACANCSIVYAEETLLSIPLHFPDEVFGKYVSDMFDVDGHASLNAEELAALQATEEVSVNGPIDGDGGIKNLQGVEYFTSLTTLNCSYNPSLTSLDLSQNTKLTKLNIEFTEMRNLNVANTQLADLNLGAFWALETLDVTDTPLTNLQVASESIKTLDLSTNDELLSLDVCGCHQLQGLDLTPCVNLTKFRASNTQIPTLDFSKSTKLSSLMLDSNLSLTNLNLSGCNLLNSLDIYSETAIKELDVSGMVITTLDTSSFADLERLDISDSSIKALNLMNNEKLGKLITTDADLEILHVGSPYLESLDVSTNTALREFNINNCTLISAIDLSENDALTTFTCGGGSGLIEIDLSGKENLSTLTVVGCPDLESLNINGCTSLTETNLITLNGLKSIEANGSGLTGLVTTMMPALEELSIENTGITTVDLSANPELRTLSVSGTNIINLNLMNCTNLESLNVQNVPLQDLKLAGDAITGAMINSAGLGDTLQVLWIEDCPNLKFVNLSNYYSLMTLHCTNSGLRSLDLSSNNQLQDLTLTGSSNLTDLMNLESCYNLYNLDVSGTAITTLNVQSLGHLGALELNSKVEKIYAAGCYSLSGLDLTECSNLTDLVIPSGVTDFTFIIPPTDCNITSLYLSNASLTFEDIDDYSMFENLTELVANGSGIDDTEWGYIVPHLNNQIEILHVGSNELSSIDISEFTNLKILNIEQNRNIMSLDLPTSDSQLTYLDISTTSIGPTDISFAGCSELTYLDVTDTRVLQDISGVGLSNCTKLERFFARNTSLTDSTELFSVLPASLTELDLSANKLAAYGDASKFTNLQTLTIGEQDVAVTGSMYGFLQDIPSLTVLNINKQTLGNLNDLDLSKNTQLRELYLREATAITSLDLTANTNLETIYTGGRYYAGEIEFPDLPNTVFVNDNEYY